MRRVHSARNECALKVAIQCLEVRLRDGNTSRLRRGRMEDT